MNNLIYGLDFGTSNTAISLSSSGKTEVLPIGIDGAKSIPSIIFTQPAKDAFFVGDTAIDAYYEALRGHTSGHSRLMTSLKMLLPLGFDDEIYVPRQGFCTLEKLISLILSEVKKRADKLAAADITSVVMGRPGRFAKSESVELAIEGRLRQAAELAGFETIHFQREPIAAALHYETLLSCEETVLVVDLGGGTSDFTVARLSPKRINVIDRASDILGTDSVAFAGDELDALITWKLLGPYFGAGSQYQVQPSGSWLEVPAPLIQKISDWRHLAQLLSKPDQEFMKQLIQTGNKPDAIRRLHHLVKGHLGYELLDAVRTAKCELVNGMGTVRFHDDPINIEEPLTEKKFEEIAEEGLEKIRSCALNLLDTCGLSTNDIGSVFTTGGTSLLPAVQSMFIELFGEKKLKSSDAFTSVAHGLGLSAGKI
ncbi:MAG: Hsp70 family protein [Candidatus Paceibacterota bacterium]|jgi:hypothetical chaperone protein